MTNQSDHDVYQRQQCSNANDHGTKIFRVPYAPCLPGTDISSQCCRNCMENQRIGNERRGRATRDLFAPALIATRKSENVLSRSAERPESPSRRQPPPPESATRCSISEYESYSTDCMQREYHTRFPSPSAQAADDGVEMIVVELINVFAQGFH